MRIKMKILHWQKCKICENQKSDALKIKKFNSNK